MAKSCVLLVLVCLLSFACYAFGSLEVTKTVQAGSNGVYTVSVGYRSVGHSKAYGVVIVDSLPKTLDLVSGELVVKVEEPATEEWTYNTYQVKARGVDFTLAHRSVDIELPAAEVSYSTASGNTATNHTVSTKPVSLTVELVIPQGTLNLTPVIIFFTLVFPVAAAYYGIPYFRKAELKNKKKKKRS